MGKQVRANATFFTVLFEYQIKIQNRPLYLLVLIMTKFLFSHVDERIQSLEGRRFKAQRGLAEATPRWHKEKARLTRTRNYIILEKA